MKLSIVIPAYKVEKYIEKTLRSILSQSTYSDDVEIIVVIDGSPDRSAEVVEKIINEGNNIILIKQDNQGLSMARNNGLKMATGDYVWFIDSDDWLPDNSLSTLLNYMDGETDEIDFGAIEIADDELTIIANKSFVEGEQNYSMSGIEIWEKRHPHIATAQLSIYCRKFLIDNNLYFHKGIFHEDYEFCPRASLLSKKTTVLNLPLYCQRVNPCSITHTINPKKSYDYIIVANSLFEFIKDQKVSCKVRRRFYYYISMAINNAMDNMRLCDSIEIKSFNILLQKHKKLFAAFLRSLFVPYIIEALIFYALNNRYIEVYSRFK